MTYHPRLLAAAPWVLLVASIPQSAAKPDKPTFAEDIGPVIHRSCAPCHGRGGPGPFALSTYEDVRKRVKQINDDLGSYHMPPCNASSDFGSFCTYQPLTDQEFVQFLNWKNAGMPSGDLSKLGPAPQPGGCWRLGKPDLVLRVGKGTHVDAASAPFWRTTRVELPGVRTIRAFDVRAASAPVVRHVLVSRAGPKSISGDRAAGGASVSGARPSDLVGSWAVGHRAAAFPPGVGVRAKALDVEVQFQPTGRREDAQIELAIYFAKGSTTAEPAWRTLGVRDFKIPVFKDVTLTSDWAVAKDTRLYAFEPEGGFFPATMSLILRLPSGKTRVLARIERWNPSWQGSYSFDRPPLLPAGSTVIASARYRNLPEDVHDLNHPLPLAPKDLVSGNAPNLERFWFHLATSR